MRKRSLPLLLASGVLVLSLAIVPGAAFAHEGHDHDDDTTTTEQQRKATQERMNASGQGRLEANRLLTCEEREARIRAIMARSAKRAGRQIEVFLTIAERTKAFYAEKGRTIDNYDDLVAAVNTAQATANTSAEAVKNLEDFACDSDNPKGDVAAFREANAQLREDMKAYRTAVKNLIVGVKSAQGETSNEQ